MQRILLAIIVVTVSACGKQPATNMMPGNGGAGGGGAAGAGGGGGAVDAAAPSDFDAAPDLAAPTVADMTTPTPDPVLRSLAFQTHDPIYLALTGDGSPFVTGGLVDSSRFADLTLVAAAQMGVTITLDDLYVVGFTPTALKTTWGNRFGDGASQQGSSIGVNAAKEVLVGGLFAGDLQLRSDLTLSTGDTERNFIVAFDGATGNALWARVLDLGPGGVVYGIAADPKDGGFVIAAMARAAVSFGTFTGTAGGGRDLFVAKVAGDAAGTLSWARQIGGAGDQLPLALTVDGNGHAYVVGQYAGTLDFGDGALPVPPAGARHMFVANLDSSTGSAHKSIALGDRGAHFAQTVAVDGAGDVLVGGIITAPVTFDAAQGLTLSAAGQDGFVAKLSGDLQHARWARRIGDVISGSGDGGVAQSTDQQRVNAVAVDATGNIVVAGGFRGVTDFGLGTRTAQGWDAFALALGKDGSPRWLRTTGGAADESATAVAYSASDGSVWVAGSFTAAVATKPYANWGSDPVHDLVFATDDGSTPHTFLVNLMP